MGQALYRKHRPKRLADVVGQKHITDTLAKAVQTGRISHAYLLSGPRGVGKTSIARILAHEINGLPYEDDSVQLDIIEIDAASNRRIDEIRELRDKVYIAPTSGKYKVYIIDEVHMLTREAFNALLKTLEEPPAHAVFILATTEAHKLPETIVSRTQHYTFRPVPLEQVTAHLKHIAESEGINISDEALRLLAQHGEGSFRDSISVLDQASGLGDGLSEITVDNVRQLLGIAPESAIDEIVSTLQAASGPAAIMQQIAALYDQGLQAANIAAQLSSKLRASLVQGKPLLQIAVLLKLLDSLVNAPASYDPERALEICLLQVNAGPLPVQQAAAPPVAAPQPAPTKPAPIVQAAVAEQVKPAAVTQPAAKVPEPVVAPIAEPIVAVAAVQPATAAFDSALWPQLLDSIKKQYNTIYGVLRMADPVFTADGLELKFKFAFHQKRINEVKNKQIIADFVRQLTGNDIAIICTFAKKEEASDVAAISNIFGGAEVIK